MGLSEPFTVTRSLLSTVQFSTAKVESLSSFPWMALTDLEAASLPVRSRLENGEVHVVPEVQQKMMETDIIRDLERYIDLPMHLPVEEMR